MSKLKRKLSESDASDWDLEYSKLSDDEDTAPKSNSSSFKSVAKKSRQLESDASDSENLGSPPEKSETPSCNDYSSEDDFKPILPKSHESIQNDIIKSVKTSILSDSSDEEPLAAKGKITSKQIKSNKAMEDTSESEEKIASSDEVKPISKVAEVVKLKGKSGKISIPSDSSDDEYLAVKNKTTARMTKTNRKAICTSESEGIGASSDEEEPLSKVAAESKMKEMAKKASISSDSSDDEPLAAKHKTTSKQTKSNKKAVCTSESERNCSSSDEEKPLSRVSKVKSKPKKKSMSVSSSDEVPLAANSKKLESELNENGHDISSDDEQSLANIKAHLSKPTDKSKKASVSSDNSDVEPLAVKSKKSSAKQSKDTKKNQKRKSNVNSLVLSDDEDTPISKLTKTSKGTRKSKTPSNSKIEHLKKYLRATGIRIKCYDTIFKNCKSMKSKAEKLLSILVEQGLKGQPTLEKCKKLRMKIEVRKEIDELDKSNILSSAGRSKRTNNNAPLRTSNIENSPAKKRFSHLRDIIDSEESD